MKKIKFKTKRIIKIRLSNKSMNINIYNKIWAPLKSNKYSKKSYKINNTAISAALPSLTWGEVKNGKSGMVIS